MTTDQLTAAQREAGAGFLDGNGWGLGMSVGGGLYGWAGGLGTMWSTAPAEQTVVLLLTQRALWTWPSTLFEAFATAS